MSREEREEAFAEFERMAARLRCADDERRALREAFITETGCSLESLLPPIFECRPDHVAFYSLPESPVGQVLLLVGIPCEADPSIPRGTAELRAKDGQVVRIVGLAT